MEETCDVRVNRQECVLAQILPSSVNPATTQSDGFPPPHPPRGPVPYAPADRRSVRRWRAHSTAACVQSQRASRSPRVSTIAARGTLGRKGEKRARCRRTQRETRFRRGADRSWILNCIRARNNCRFLPAGGVRLVLQTSGTVRLRDETCLTGGAYPALRRFSYAPCTVPGLVPDLGAHLRRLWAAAALVFAPANELH